MTTRSLKQRIKSNSAQNWYRVVWSQATACITI